MIDSIASEVSAACAAAFPGVKLAPVAIADRLAQLDLATFDRGHLADLGLAWACLGRDPAAEKLVDRMIRAEAQRAVAELRKPADLVDEVHQELAQRLLVGDRPRLAQYAGQSALGRWLGVAALRTALNLTRKARPERPIADDDHDLIAAVVDPELAAIKNQYKREVEHAIRSAFEALDNARDRNLLRLYYLDRVGLDRLGQMYGVHASTVSRWLATLRESIVSDTHGRLGEVLGASGNYADVASLIRAVRSDLDVTLSRILRPTE
ncbi:MAG: sigma-70 family RNA polymerase sigma factor [Myxococcota bacterium]|nr:sigma-70 family RNA polymerase sigma factor [Myxococcota bacterium]